MSAFPFVRLIFLCVPLMLKMVMVALSFVLVYKVFPTMRRDASSVPFVFSIAVGLGSSDLLNL